MNWRTGLTRIWIVLAACWIGYVIWSLSSGCFYFSDSPLFRPICATGEVRDGVPVAGYLTAFDAKDWLRWIAFGFGPPILALAVGLAIGWALKGFGKKPKSN